MFSSSLTAVAVTGLVMSGTIATQPAWQSDYRTALTLAARQQKPVAVFISQGDAGYARLITDGGLSPDVGTQLRQNYVCLYVDTTKSGGKELASAFGMNRGLVISDKSGGVQALRHEGTLPRADLGRYLDRYSKSNQVVETTIIAGQAAPPAAPVYVQPYQPPVYPAFAPAFSPFSGGMGGMSFG